MASARGLSGVPGRVLQVDVPIWLNHAGLCLDGGLDGGLDSRVLSPEGVGRVGRGLDRLFVRWILSMTYSIYIYIYIICVLLYCTRLYHII